jgi:hypothetical protein
MSGDEIPSFDSYVILSTGLIDRAYTDKTKVPGIRALALKPSTWRQIARMIRRVLGD